MALTASLQCSTAAACKADHFTVGQTHAHERQSPAHLASCYELQTSTASLGCCYCQAGACPPRHVLHRVLTPHTELQCKMSRRREAGVSPAGGREPRSAPLICAAWVRAAQAALQ